MTNKSVLEIEVQDEQFKAFYDLFEEYKKHLGSTPDDWKKIDQATKKAARSFDSVAQSTGALGEIALHTKTIADHFAKATKAQKAFQKETRGAAKELKGMAKSAKDLGSHIFGIGKYLFKMGAIGGGLGALGLFGLRGLGDLAIGRQKEARSLGMTPGQVAAWGTDLNRYLGIGSVQQVGSAQVNSRDWGSLIMATQGTGINLPQALRMAPDQLTHAIAKAAANRWNSESAVRRGVDPFLQAQEGLLGGVGALRNLAAAQRHGEFAKGWAKYQQDSRAFNYGSATTNKWFSLTRELSALGHSLETNLIKKLAALAPPLSDLIKTMGTDGRKLIDEVLTPRNIDSLKAGINTLTSYLGSKQFMTDVQNAGTALSTLVHAIAWAAKEINKWVAPGKTPPMQKVTISNLRNPYAGSSIPQGLLLHNPGNLRAAPGVPSVGTGNNGAFAQFSRNADAYKAMAWTLAQYPSHHHVDTIAGIIPIYNGHGANDAQYIRRVARWSHIKPNQRIDFNNPGMVSRLISAMVREETSTSISPSGVLSKINESSWHAPGQSISKLLSTINPRRSSGLIQIHVNNKAGSNVAVALNGAAH